MRNFKARGTLGDTYIFCCKLKAMGSPKTTMWHNTKHEYWKQEIHDIYSLVSNVKPVFTDYLATYPEITSNVHEGKVEWFPQWHWNMNYEYLLEMGDYMVIQPEAGKPQGYNHKEFPLSTIMREINQADMPVVILGTSSKFKYIGGDHNLIGETDILQAMQIAALATRFIGPEGLLSFVALSHKVESEIYFKSHEAVQRRIINTPWEKYATKLAYIGE